ncbi:hypothetical protein CPC16_011167 [Podila verticillata]|nr:hypothetical protein BGZ52_011996 [Haplosporangium bisporale]KAF9211826.1 hypothetical protein BGZ59_007566 [Podila verticillata]KAF9378690.1 hypothetical protein CPC16_011167 [Podila verticillata]KFH65967.1 hypothetical protein MVEG_08069 [Podila verticillata NRRL 6337]
MDTEADQYVLTAEDELDLDLTLSSEANIAGNGTNYHDSMLELEHALEEETRDITDRFSNERRPEPTGLDRALGSSNYRSTQRERQNEQPKYASRSGGFVTGFDPLSKEEREKKASRAQRFGAISQHTEVKEQTVGEESGMDVDEGDWKRPTDLPETPPRTSMIRLESVHLYGTNEMSTKDVLKYFEAYGPSHVEWIDDSSCNVVFKDNYSAKRALYYQLVDEEANFGEDEEEGALLDVEPARPLGDDAAAVLVPRSNNRLQRAKEYIPVQQHNQPMIQNNKGLYLRYATDFDVKERGAASRSTYYQIHGREESKRTGSSNSRHSNSQHQYGRRSRADEDEVWARGRDPGIRTFSSLRRKMERGSESPSPSRHRSWSRNRLLTGSRSRSRSSSRSRRSDRSRSPGLGSLRDRASRSPDSGRFRSDDYGNRGRRGDISLRLGGRVTQPDEVSSLAVENRINDLADDFLSELESTFTRREKTIPKSRTLYSDFYEKEYLTEAPTRSRTNEGVERQPMSRDRDDYRRRDYSPRRSNGGGRRERGRGGRDKSEALKAVEARLGLPASIDARLGNAKDEVQGVDEFGRTRK